MSNPNLVSPSTITGSTAVLSLTATTATQLLTNAANSNHAYKINSLIVSNVTATAANITVSLYSAATLGGTANEIASTIAVPAYASLIVIDKTTTFYLVEDKSIGVTAGTANALKVTVSYEDIS